MTFLTALLLILLSLGSLIGAYEVGKVMGAAEFECVYDDEQGQRVGFWSNEDMPFGPDYSRERLIFDI